MVKFRFFAPVGAVAALMLTGCTSVTQPAGPSVDSVTTLATVAHQVSEAPAWLTSAPVRREPAVVVEELPESSEVPVGSSLAADVEVGVVADTSGFESDNPAPVVEETVATEAPAEPVESPAPESTPDVAGQPPVGVVSGDEPVVAASAPVVNNSPGASLPVSSFTDGLLIAAGSGPQLVESFVAGGAGYVNIDYSRDPNSAVPNVPTFTEIRCDGKKMYFGAHNATTGTGWQLPASFTGSTCDVYVDARQPSANYNGTYSGVYVRVGAPVVTQTGGTPVRVQGGSWVSQAVPGVSDFVYDTPVGFRGAVDLKLTACSSQGGTSDASAAFACGTLAEPGVGSTVNVEWFDAAGSLGSQRISISAQEHHSMLHFDLPRAVAGSVTARVTRIDGSAMLVHSVHSNAIGIVP